MDSGHGTWQSEWLCERSKTRTQVPGARPTRKAPSHKHAHIKDRVLADQHFGRRDVQDWCSLVHDFLVRDIHLLFTKATQPRDRRWIKNRGKHEGTWATAHLIHQFQFAEVKASGAVQFLVNGPLGHEQCASGTLCAHTLGDFFVVALHAFKHTPGESDLLFAAALPPTHIHTHTQLHNHNTQTTPRECEGPKQVAQQASAREAGHRSKTKAGTFRNNVAWPESVCTQGPMHHPTPATPTTAPAQLPPLPPPRQRTFLRSRGGLRLPSPGTAPFRTPPRAPGEEHTHTMHPKTTATGCVIQPAHLPTRMPRLLKPHARTHARTHSTSQPRRRTQTPTTCSAVCVVQ